MDFNIKDYGAVSGGEHMNTKAIQAAIDACADNGGGRVIISDGIYLSGSITLKRNIDLHIEGNAVLLGSANCDDFPEKENLNHVISGNLPRTRNACFIFSEEQENISITGMGKIDCNGHNFVTKKENNTYGWDFDRIDLLTPPRVVFFTGCKNIKIEDITMVNQPSGWSYWIHDCDYVTFNKCKIDANVNYPNNDGIHINSSRNVTISNCSISCGDDCIIVRANNRSLRENKVCEKVVVANCNLTSYSGGIRIGWHNDGIIRNCVFSNIVMNDTSVGISIFLPYTDNPDQGREATLIENISFDNFIMDPIYGTPIKIYIEENDELMCEAIRNLSFSNIRARGLQFPQLKGRKNNVIKDITFNNCSFEKVSDEVLPNYETHGAAAWDRPKDGNMFDFCENITVNNTTFKSN